jgi:hypothetical protein
VVIATLEEEPILAVENLRTFVVHGTAGTQETERESGRIFASVSVVKEDGSVVPDETVAIDVDTQFCRKIEEAERWTDLDLLASRFRITICLYVRAFVDSSCDRTAPALTCKVLVPRV